MNGGRTGWSRRTAVNPSLRRFINRLAPGRCYRRDDQTGMFLKGVEPSCFLFDTVAFTLADEISDREGFSEKYGSSVVFLSVTPFNRHWSNKAATQNYGDFGCSRRGLNWAKGAAVRPCGTKVYNFKGWISQLFESLYPLTSKGLNTKINYISG